LASCLRSVLDGLVIAASLLLVSWAVVLGAVFRAGGTNLADVIGLAYPVGDVVNRSYGSPSSTPAWG